MLRFTCIFMRIIILSHANGTPSCFRGVSEGVSCLRAPMIPRGANFSDDNTHNRCLNISCCKKQNSVRKKRIFWVCHRNPSKFILFHQVFLVRIKTFNKFSNYLSKYVYIYYAFYEWFVEIVLFEKKNVSTDVGKHIHSAWPLDKHNWYDVPTRKNVHPLPSIH